MLYPTMKCLHSVASGSSHILAPSVKLHSISESHIYEIWIYQNGAPRPISICNLTSLGDPIVEIRWSKDRLISTMGFPILLRRHLYIESWSRIRFLCIVSDRVRKASPNKQTTFIKSNHDSLQVQEQLLPETARCFHEWATGHPPHPVQTGARWTDCLLPKCHRTN